MADWRRSRNRNVSPSGAGTKAGFPRLDIPPDSKIDIKNIAYLHVWCRMTPTQIVAKFPAILTVADVHLALAHYYRDPKKYDAEIKREREFNCGGTLVEFSMGGVGLQSLVEVGTSDLQYRGVVKTSK